MASNGIKKRRFENFLCEKCVKIIKWGSNMEKVKLTISFMKKLLPGQGSKFADMEVPGLQVRVGANSVSYYLRKRQGKKIHEVAIGRHPDITLDEARQKALEMLGALANYQNIEAPSGRRQPTVRDAVELLISQMAHPAKTVSMMKHWEFLFDVKICDLTPEVIKSKFKSMAETPTAANRAVRYLKTAFNKISKKLNTPNFNDQLFADITPYPEKPRLRFLQESEAPKVIDAIKSLRSNYRYAAQADALLVMLFTGQRKTRVLHMNIGEINLATKEWYVPGNEKKREVTHPFNDEAWKIIESRFPLAEKQGGFLFTWRGKPLNDCRKTLFMACQQCGVTNLTIHDLRRSLGTWMLSSGASIESVAKTLGNSVEVAQEVYAHILNSRGRQDTAAAIAAMKKGEV
jgi:integrase